MKMFINNLFQSEKRFRKVIAIFVASILLFSVGLQGALAAAGPPPGPNPPDPTISFWRTLRTSEYISSTDQPTLFKYGWGYGDLGWGYGFGYGYNEGSHTVGYYVGAEAYENPAIVTAIGLGDATILGGNPANTTQVTMKRTVSFSPGAGIEVVLPDGLQINQSGGGTFDATAIQAAVGTAGTGDLGSAFSIGAQIDFGASGMKLLFSIPVKVVIPVPGVANGTSIPVLVRHFGEPFTSASLSVDPAATCDALGNATPTTTVAVASGGSLVVYTCAASQFVTYTSTGTGGTSNTTGGGGGAAGGGSAISSAPSDSNTATSSLVSVFNTIVNQLRTYTRSLQVAEALITENAGAGTKTATLTGSEGVITHKPNSKSTIWATIPPNTSVTGTMDWDGLISPPLVRADSIVSTFGDTVTGGGELKRSDVIVAVKAGSGVSPLTFSNAVELVVPVGLANGTPVRIFYSDDGDNWGSSGTATVMNGAVTFNSTHFSYFALSSSLSEGDYSKGMHGFQDIAGHWAESYIRRISDLGIVSGKTDTSFAPNDNITRAELTKIATKAFGVEIDPNPSFSPFADVSLNDWFAPYVVAARSVGIVEGIGNEKFAPNTSINRVDALKILLESANFDSIEGDVASFSDTMSGAWYMKYVSFAKNHEVVSGYGNGTFGPANNMTRAEVAKVVTKIMDLQAEDLQ